MKLIYACLFLFAIVLSACSDNGTGSDDDETLEYNKITEGYTGGIKVEIYSDQQPFVGYNRIYVALSDSITKERIDDAVVSFSPLMDMGTMVHACPFENPEYNIEEKLYMGACTFIMSGMWTYEINISGGNHSGNYSFEFNVQAASLVKNIDASDGHKYFVTMIQPEKWQVGMNDIEFCINYRETMMHFPAKKDLNIEMVPWMDMGGGTGHGSPNNENPEHEENGHYKGKINFTMSGGWDINLAISNADSVIIETTYQVVVE